MACAAKGFFQNDFIVAKGRECFSAGGSQQRGKFLGARYDAHAATTATCGGFQHQRVTDRCRLLCQLLVTGRALKAGNAGYPGLHSEFFCPSLVAHQLDDIGGGSDKCEAGRGAGAGKVGIFR